MSTSRRKIATNILFLASSQGITWIMTAVYTVFVPRYLGPEGMGTLAVALAISSILLIVSSLGSTTFILREVARDHNTARWLVSTAITINVTISALVWIIVLGIFALLNVSNELKLVIAIFAINNLLAVATVPLTNALKGMEKMQYSLIDSLVTKGFYVGLGVLFAVLQFGVVMVALAQLLSVIPSFLLNFWWFSRTSKLTLRFSNEDIKTVLQGGRDFFIIEVTFQAYLYLDALLLSFLTSETVVGYYSTPTNLFGTMLFIPVVVSNAILPALSRIAKQDPDNHKIMTRNTLSFFVAVSLPMAVGVTVIAQPLILFLYDKQFAPSIPILIILGWTVIPTYLGIGIYQSLIAENRQWEWTKVNIAATIINLVLNLVTIPLAQNFWSNGAIGAAGALLCSELLVTSLGFRLLSKGVINGQFWRVALKSLIATAVMGVAVVPLLDTFILVPIVVGVLVYGLMALLTGLIPASYRNLALGLPQQLRKRFTQ